MNVAVAGGHGKVALRLTRRLRERGDAVRSLIRNPAHASDVQAAGGEPVVCDLERADFHPKGEVARAYSVWREPDGFSERALYVVDPDGTIAYSQVTPYVHHVPDIYELFDALDEVAGVAQGR